MGKTNKDDLLVLVSFKVSKALYEQLMEYAKSQKDDAGVQLSPSLAARRLMYEGLKKAQQKKP